MNKLNLFFIFAILVLIAAPLAMASGSVVITPNPANTQSTLTCTVTVGGSGYTYAWSRNGAATGITGAYVQPGYLYAGDTWTCKVTKYYPGGIGWVTIGSDSRYINAIPVNNPPSAQITSPANWAAFTVGTSINFVGSGWDSEDGVLSGASLQWYVDGVNFGSGNSFNYAGLSVGQHQITLIATDSGGPFREHGNNGGNKSSASEQSPYCSDYKPGKRRFFYFRDKHQFCRNWQRPRRWGFVWQFLEMVR